MRKQVWYGYSKQDGRTHFFDKDPQQGQELEGTGNFTIDGEVNGLNIETVQPSAEGRQTERA